jgi:CRISPR system Cascade subunit CasA
MKRRKMGVKSKTIPEFNLLDEPWLVVMVDERGTTKEVSLKDLFAHAHEYKCLAGETPTQDFAILRLLLSILHTVFSRFDAHGNPYEYLKLDDKYKQIEVIDEDDEDDYREELLNTWKNLWDAKSFPEIVGDYLEKWRDRFYLFGGEFPFYQFREIGDSDYAYDAKGYEVDKLDGLKLASGKGTDKVVNLFNKNQSDFMGNEGAARWLIYVNNYAEARSGRPKTGSKKKGSPGLTWIGRTSGLHVQGSNLFETLMINLVMKTTDQMNGIQTPIWEAESTVTNFENQSLTYTPNNEAELYTYPSRFLLLTRDDEKMIVGFLLDTGFSNFNKGENLHNIEPMSLWRKSDKKSLYTPIRVNPIKYFWQEFSSYESIKSSRLVDWINKIREHIGDNHIISLVSVGEYYEQKDGKVKDSVAGVLTERAGIIQTVEDSTRFSLSNISDEVDLIKKVIDEVLWLLASKIGAIRKPKQSESSESSESKFADRVKQEAYYQIDLPFRNWLASIQPNDNKEEKIKAWRGTLRAIIEAEAKKLLDSAGNRDFIGIEKDGNIENIFTAYNKFKYKINEHLPKEKEKKN